MRTFLFCALLISLPPGFSRPPSLLTSFSCSWTMSWCLTIAASVPHTHTQIQCCLRWYCLVNVYSPPTLWMTFQYCLGVCITSASLWVQINSICAFSDWLFCVFLCIAIKAVRKHRALQRLFFFLLIPSIILENILFSRLGCRWQLYMMQYSLPLKTNMLTCSSLWGLNLLLIKLFLYCHLEYCADCCLLFLLFFFLSSRFFFFHF